MASAPAYELHVSIAETVTAGEEQEFFVTIQNVGEASTAGPISFTETFSEGLTPLEVVEGGGTSSQVNVPTGKASCEVEEAQVKCISPGPLPPGAQMSYPIY